MKLKVYDYDENNSPEKPTLIDTKTLHQYLNSNGTTTSWIRVSGDDIQITKDGDKDGDTISNMEKKLDLPDKYKISSESSDQYDTINIKKDTVIISLNYPYYKKEKKEKKEKIKEKIERLKKQKVTDYSLKIIFSKNHLISISEKEIDNFNRVGKRITEKGLSNEKIKNTDYLAYALIKSLIDNYFYIIDMIGKDIFDLNSMLSEETTADKKENLEIIQNIRVDMMNLRKSIYPLKALFSELLDTESTLITKETRDFFRHLQDHVFQLMDLLAIARDQVSTSMEVFLTRTTTKMNEVMKVLTILAAIFLPLTFITGIYGMNFIEKKDVFFDKEATYTTEPFFWGIIAAMAILALVLIIVFKIKHYFD